MIHLRKDLCGYISYTCIGIEEYSQSLLLHEPVCDNINYDLYSGTRPIDNNFLNLPTTFKTIVQNVPFIDLGKDAVWDATKCVTDYTPLQGQAIDAFSYLQSNSAFIAGYADYRQGLQCYASNNMEEPGILLPASQLSLFGQVPLQAVPTQALASAVQPSTDSSRGIKSGCDGFYTTARATGSYKVTFSISGGQVYVATNSVGEPVAVPVAPLSNQICQGREDVQSIAIYAIAGFDIVNGTWNAVLDWKSPNNDFYESTPTHWIKQKQIATIKYVNGQIIDVIQSECSPIDLRDWVSQEPLPTTDGNFVFVYKGNSAKKEWVEVRDC